MDQDLQARPPRHIDPAFAAVTEDQISLLVDSFYSAIRSDERLGPIFDNVIKDNWAPHLSRMKGFWRSVILKTGEYDGRPVPAHMAIPDLQEDDFRLWLNLFEKTAKELMDDQAAVHIVITARRIARSLWFARFGTPFSDVPHWLQ